MKSNSPILIPSLVIGAGVVVCAGLLRRPLDRPQPTGAPSAAPAPRAPAPTLRANASFSRRPVVRAPSAAGRVQVQAVVRAKLQQWFATTTGDTEKQEALIQELLGLLTDENTADVIQGLSPQEWDTPFSTAALDRWLRLDPAGAARWIATRTDAREEHALLVVCHLMETPAALEAYCDRLPETLWKQRVLRYAALERVAKDPAAAISLAQRMAAGEVKTDALETIAYDWFGRDLTAAMDWTGRVNDPVLRERLMAVGAKAIANADPDLAAGWLVASVKTEGVLSETALSVVETWTLEDPPQAAAWVARFSDAGPRRAAIDLVLSHWLKSDPASARAWIQSLPERASVLEALRPK